MLDELKDRELVLKIEDTEYVPTANRWEFGQRLTEADMIERPNFPLNMSVVKSTTEKIAGLVTGERQKSGAGPNRPQDQNRGGGAVGDNRRGKDFRPSGGAADICHSARERRPPIH